jgi:hypothetical protein
VSLSGVCGHCEVALVRRVIELVPSAFKYADGLELLKSATRGDATRSGATGKTELIDLLIELKPEVLTTVENVTKLLFCAIDAKNTDMIRFLVRETTEGVSGIARTNLLTETDKVGQTGVYVVKVVCMFDVIFPPAGWSPTYSQASIRRKHACYGGARSGHCPRCRQGTYCSPRQRV